MNAIPHLMVVLQAMRAAGLEGILVGNAGAAVQGAPVTTMDFDFLIRPYAAKTSAKIRKLAGLLHASVSRPYYPLSKMVRLQNADGIIVDLLPPMGAFRSFESLRSRSNRIDLGQEQLRVASLKDIIAGKRSAGRLKDLAVLPLLEEVLREKEEQAKGRTSPRHRKG